MDFRSYRRSTAPSKKRVKLRRRLALERLTNRRVLAAITGTVFADIDQSYRQEAGEESLASRLVYLDVNQNAAIDTGEPFSLTDDSGVFEFTGLPDGEYHVRLFDGSTTQTQVTPVDATRNGAAIMVADGTDIATDDAQVAVLNANSLTIGSYETGLFDSLLISDSPLAMEQLPSGDYLIVGGDASGDTAWLADPVAKTLEPLALSDNGNPVAWTDVVVDSNGHGLLLERTDDATLVRSLDASDVDAGIVVVDNGVMFPNDASVHASETGNRSVVAWAGQWTDESGTHSGLQLSLWSNASGSLISYSPASLPDTTELLDYDDASGLVALRNTDGGVSLYDVNSDFALLSALPEVTGPVAIDGQRELLVAMSVTASTLQLIDAHDGQSLAELPIAVEDIGPIKSIQVQQSSSLVLLGDKGTSRISLVKPAANRVTLVGGSDSDRISFGATTQGDNSLPQFSITPTFSIDEDETLFVPAPGPLASVVDSENDDVVILQMGPSSNGTAIVTLNGDVQYTPDLNFNGLDALPVMLHDGRGASSLLGLPIDVIPVDDPPEIIMEVEEIAENLPPESVVGPVVIVDPDLNDENELRVDDLRFEIRDGVLIFIGPGVINFEEEPTIDLGIYTSDYASSVTYTLNVTDENDPIEFIEPEAAEVNENVEGAEIAVLFVYDEDIDEVHTVTVDDDRFVIDDDLRLSLAPGVSLDFEAEPTVTVNVTATGKDDSLTEPIVITVIDEIEQASQISLSNETVLEMEPGAEVGDVIVDGNVIGDGYTASVDDSRFEIVDSTLKLVDGTWVDLADQQEIELTIDVQDIGGTFESVSQTFVITVLENSSPSHNDDNPFDVDGSGEITPLDALIIINYINEHGVGEITNFDPRFDLDVNGDGIISPLDILLILNKLDAIRQQQQAGVSGEKPSGEQIPTANPRGSDLIAKETGKENETPVVADPSQQQLPTKQAKRSSSAAIAFTPSIDSDILASDSADQAELVDREFADGVDASLDSLLDEMS